MSFGVISAIGISFENKCFTKKEIKILDTTEVSVLNKKLDTLLINCRELSENILNIINHNYDKVLYFEKYFVLNKSLNSK